MLKICVRKDVSYVYDKIIKSLWEIGDVEDIINVDVFEVVGNIAKGASEFFGSRTINGILGRMNHVIVSLGSEKQVSLLVHEIGLVVKLPELLLNILGLLLDLGEGSVVHSYEWHWVVTSLQVSFDGHGNIQGFLLGFDS